jgi:hypothetical protein
VDNGVQNFLWYQIKNNTEDAAPRFKPFDCACWRGSSEVAINQPQLPAIFGISDFHVN